MRDMSRNTDSSSTGSTGPKDKARFWLNLPCGTGFPVPTDSPLHGFLEAGVTMEQLLVKWAECGAYVRDCQQTKKKFSYFD